MTHSGENIPNQFELTDEQLAEQYVERELPLAQSGLEGANRTLDWVSSPSHRPYRPSHPGPRPHPEAGGMDHQDWEIAAIEYHEFEETDEVEDAENEVWKYESQVDALTEDKELIEAGDAATITFRAGLERARLEKEAKEAALRQIRAGKELPLAQESYGEAARIVDVIDGAKLKPGDAVGSNGWRFAAVAQNRDIYKGALSYGYVFERNPGQGTFGAYTDRIIVGGKTYAPSDVTEGVTVQHFELPEAVAAVESPVSNQVLLTAEEVTSYTLRLDEQGVVRQQEYRKGIVMDDRSPKKFTYEEGQTGITSIYMARADYKGDTSLVTTEQDMQNLHGLLTGLAEDVTDMGIAVGYDPDAPKPPEPPRPVADVFDDVKNTAVKGGQEQLIETSYWQGQSTTKLSSATEAGTAVEKNDNYHGGHQTLGTTALTTNAAGLETKYSADVSTYSWGSKQEGPLHGTYRVSKRNSEGEEVYSFSTRRRGAAEKLTRLTLRYIAGSLPEREA